MKQNVEGPAFELSDTQIVFLKNYKPADNKKAYKITEHAKSIYIFFKYFIYSHSHNALDSYLPKLMVQLSDIYGNLTV